MKNELVNCDQHKEIVKSPASLRYISAVGLPLAVKEDEVALIIVSIPFAPDVRERRLVRWKGRLCGVKLLKFFKRVIPHFDPMKDMNMKFWK